MSQTIGAGSYESFWRSQLFLGGGTPLFPATGYQASPELVSAKPMSKGCVRLHYRF